MRSKKPDFDGVLAEFEMWRAKPRGRLIPDELWKAAVGLLDRYSSSAICRHLGLNPGRFKQIRGAGGVAAGERRARGRHGAGGRAERAWRAGPRLKTVRQRASLAASGDAFVELGSLSVAGGGGMLPPTVAGMPRGTAGVRLTLESAAGTLSVVTATPDPGLADAVCRVVLRVLGDGSQA